MTTKSPLHATKLPLWKWFQGIHLMLESSKGVSSVVLASWLSQHYEFSYLLTGTVELDDKFFGGAPRFKWGASIGVARAPRSN